MFRGTRSIDAREFHLDAATYQYRAESLLEHGVVLTYPFKVAVPFEELVDRELMTPRRTRRPARRRVSWCHASGLIPNEPVVLQPETMARWPFCARILPWRSLMS